MHQLNRAEFPFFFLYFFAYSFLHFQLLLSILHWSPFAVICTRVCSAHRSSAYVQFSSEQQLLKTEREVYETLVPLLPPFLSPAILTHLFQFFVLSLFLPLPRYFSVITAIKIILFRAVPMSSEHFRPDPCPLGAQVNIQNQRTLTHHAAGLVCPANSLIELFFYAYVLYKVTVW